MKHIEECKVKSNFKIAEDVFVMEIESRKIVTDSRPGQFLQIEVGKGLAPLLRRPISISEIRREDNIIVICYKAIGKGTCLLSKKKEGDTINIVGPLGNGFKIDCKSLNIGIIGGGIGVAPLLELAKTLKKENKVFTYLGFNEEVYLVDKFESYSNTTKISTVTGSYGRKGFITDAFLEDLDNNTIDMIYACGPKEMLKKVSEIAKKRNIKCQISLEERMACGFGACLGCSIETADGTMKKVCVDGPVFDSNEVIFDD